MTLQKLPAPSQGQKLYADDTLPGFAVRVSQGGTKSFLAIVGKERRFITIGRYPVVGLAAARDRARTILAEHQLGIVHRSTPTFAEVRREYLARRDTQVRGTTRQADAYIFKHFAPLMTRRLSEIAASDIEAIIDKIEAPSTKRHAHIRLSGLLSFAIRRGYIDTSPLRALPIPPDMEPRHRVLSDDELRRVLTTARMMRHAGDTYGAIIECLIYSGQRRKQIAVLHPSIVDFDTGTLTWEAAQMKTGKRHIIPLPKLMREVLVQRATDSLFFPNNLSEPFCAWSYYFRKLCREVGFSDWVVHDLRRALATRFQEMGIEIATTEKLLSHSAVTGGLVGIYQTSTYMRQMREALDQWENYLVSLMRPDTPLQDSTDQAI